MCCRILLNALSSSCARGRQLGSRARVVQGLCAYYLSLLLSQRICAETIASNIVVHHRWAPSELSQADQLCTLWGQGTGGEEALSGNVAETEPAAQNLPKRRVLKCVRNFGPQWKSWKMNDKEAECSGIRRSVAASMCMYSNAVFCNGQRNMEEFRDCSH